MKRVLVAGVLGGLLLLATPTLASSADRDDKGGGRQGHSDNRGGHDSDHRDGGRSYGGRYGYYYGDPYYYGGYDDCYHDRSGYTTCEPYGGDYDPGGYNGGYPDPPPDRQYCSHRHSAHSAQCPDEGARGDNNGVPPGTVVIRGLAFNPANTNARVGEDVMWTFDDQGVAHTVTADDGSFDSGKMDHGNFHHAFAHPGVFGYHCHIHPDMKGTVTVGRES